MASCQTIGTGRGYQPDLKEVSRHEEKEHIPMDDEKELSNVSCTAQGYQFFAETDPSNVLPQQRPLDFHEPDSNWHIAKSQLNSPSQKVFLSRRKLFCISVACILLVSAIIGGVVGGLKSRKDGPSPKETSSASSDSTGGSHTSLISTTPSSVSTGAGTSATASFNSSLASVAWADNEGQSYRRLYYQDSTGKIKEAAWNSTGESWYASPGDLGEARERSPIAAAVAGNTTWPFVSASVSMVIKDVADQVQSGSKSIFAF